VTGNTVIDALLMTVEHTRRHGGIAAGVYARYPFLHRDGKLVLVTGHRRENHEHGLASLCRALKRIARDTGVQVVYPVHPNPNVQRIASSVLADVDNVHLISPLDYPEFVWLMQRSTIILTDSGGIQEEAPSLGKPVLVLRDVTERPEALEAGTVTLVGTDENHIDVLLTAFAQLCTHSSASRAHLLLIGDGELREAAQYAGERYTIVDVQSLRELTRQCAALPGRLRRVRVPVAIRRLAGRAHRGVHGGPADYHVRVAGNRRSLRRGHVRGGARQ
jgi:UDP-N-acetylglucosamine 2-epimerase